MEISTLFAFLFAISLLVTFHEFGHYFVARLCNVKVLRFSLGMGKVIYSKKLGKDQTEWVISILPLGGYVKMLDARESEVSELDRKREFTQLNVWKRIAIVIAGPIANFILAIILFTLLYLYGLPDATSKIKLATEQSFAYQYGLRNHDVIQKIDQVNITSWSVMHQTIVEKAVEKKDVLVVVSRLSEINQKTKLEFEILLPFSLLSNEQLEGDIFTHLGLNRVYPPAVLFDVIKDGPAYKAGLQIGDEVLKVNGVKMIDSFDFSEVLRSSPNKNLELIVKRNNNELILRLKPDAKIHEGKEIGFIQVQFEQSDNQVLVKHSPVNSLMQGMIKTWDASMLTFSMLGKMVTGEVSLKNLTGPITIADYAGKSIRSSLETYITYLAFISISLGVMNLLPIPVLDGGHLLYYSLEVFMGKPIPDKYLEIAQRGGIVALICLMAVAFFNDIQRIVS